MMTTSLKVFVFAASGYAILKGVLWLFKTAMSDEEKMLISLNPKRYLAERHKGIVAMSCAMLLCQGTAIAALIVAAVMWAMSL